VVTCCGPDETTIETALPVATSVPAAGFWLITDPDGTVVLDAVVTAPVVKPALVMAAAAAACVWPTTFGAATCGTPDDTTRSTAAPLATCVPATGFWLITEPAGTVVLEAVTTAPTVRPADARLVEAAACVWPTILGTVTGGGASVAARISTAATFHRSLGGAVSLIVAVVPALATGVVIDCTQNVWAAVVSSHSCVIVWFGPSVRVVARAESLPTP